MNTLKTGILLIALTALLMFIGNILGEEVGMAIALILAAGHELRLILVQR